MKKFTALLLTICMLLSFSSCIKFEIKETEKPVGDEYKDYVRLNNDVTFEMYDPNYWIDAYGQEEKILMSLEEIEEFNEDNSKQVAIDGEIIALKDFPETVSGDSVREYVDTDMPNDLGKLLIDGEEAGNDYFKVVDRNRNVRAIGDEVEVRFGYSVKRAEGYSYPVAAFAVSEEDDYVYNDLTMCECMPYQPVVILHESLDGEWYYCYFYGFAGWIQADAIAFCHSKDEWLERMEVDDFLIVTGREIRLPHDEGCPGVSDLLIPMDTKLPLVKAEDAPESISMRIGYGCYTVKLPVRDEEGFVTDAYTYIPMSEDVNHGYLPYTSQNVIRLLSKYLGDRYGWAGSAYSNDCSGTLRAIYACFGFNMKRTASAQISQKDLNYTDISKMTDEEKIEEFKKAPMGAMVFFPGHIMIYTGMVGEEPYVFSAVGAFARPEQEEGVYDYVNTCCFNNICKTKRANGKTWLASMEAIAYPVAK